MWAIVLFSFIAASLGAYQPSDEESLALRRIADFWQEGETDIAKSQMEEFVTQFPDSPYFDTLTTALGDLLLREKSYPQALNYYARIKETSAIDKTFLNRMQCLYHLQWYATLADECEGFLSREKEGERFLQATYLLGLALYQQCLHSETSGQPDALRRTALRAKPHFDALAKSELSEEVAGAYAHLCCILQDYEGAAKLYLELASASETPEELLFQAALLQAKYDKSLSAATFDRLAKEGGARAKDAAYNQLILAFEQERFEEIVANQETWLTAAPLERKGALHLIVGKSLLALKKYADAAVQLNAFLETDKESAQQRPAVLHLVEAAYRAGDLALLERAIDRLSKSDAMLPQATLYRIELLKTQGNLNGARVELEALLADKTDFPQRTEADLERITMAASANEWESCRIWATEFVAQHPDHASVAYAWRALATASAELSRLGGNEKNRFALDLDALLKTKHFTPEECMHWRYLRAKVDFELAEVEAAAGRLEELLVNPTPFDKRADATLLLALCYRSDPPRFCAWAEKALLSNASLISSQEQRLALFNAYLAQEAFDKAAEHLLAAFFDNAEIQLANLLWLGGHLSGESALRFLEPFLARPFDAPLEREALSLKLAKLYKAQNRSAGAIALLETLLTEYRKTPAQGWTSEPEALLLLGELHAAVGEKARAEELFGAVLAKNSIKRDRFSVAASLHAIRLNLQSNPNDLRAAIQLKDLVLQKTLENEPFHLEAALDYIELQARKTPEKRLALLEKMRVDFTAQDDLLSKDYHAARATLAAQDRIYQAYMSYLDAEMCLAKARFAPDEQKELQAKAKDLLLQIKETSLIERVQQRLKEFE